MSIAGLNQLLWYYADMEKKRCTIGTNIPAANGTLPDPDACIVWRRFAKYVTLIVSSIIKVSVC